MTKFDSEFFLEALKRIVGAEYVTTDREKMAWYVTDYRHRFATEALAAVRPTSTAEVSAIAALCHQHGVAMVPQGGNTSLVGGSVPHEAKSIVINLTRMNRVRELDTQGFTMTVEAGMILSEVKRVAEESDRYFPLMIASEGSAQIGGNVAANAGGILTVGYGNTRDLILGVEAVLADGSVFNGLTKLRKDNTGYDLKQLFIGSEGTLGIITAVTLKLYTLPSHRETFLAGLSTAEAAITLYDRIRKTASGSLIAYELISDGSMELGLEHVENFRNPLSDHYQWYVLAELRTGTQNSDMREQLEKLLETALEEELIKDATLAVNEGQRMELWHIRESLSDAEREAGGSVKHDISVPVADIPAFMAQATKALHDYMPELRVAPFGHAGDGNMHFNVVRPVDMAKEEFNKHWDKIENIVFGVVKDFQGSISAEHGVGTYKSKDLPKYKDSQSLEMMRQIKRALDPKGLMNPGVILTS